MNVLTADEILVNKCEVSMPCPYIPAVYFLIDGDEIVYVGQAANLRRRLHEHKTQGVKAFTHFAYVRCNIEDLAETESKYLMAYKTKYNVQRPLDIERMMAEAKERWARSAKKICAGQVWRRTNTDDTITIDEVYVTESRYNRGWQTMIRYTTSDGCKPDAVMLDEFDDLIRRVPYRREDVDAVLRRVFAEIEQEMEDEQELANDAAEARAPTYNGGCW